MQVTRLLHLAARKTVNRVDWKRPCVMALLTRLPGARGVSADCIATLLSYGIHGRGSEFLMPLLRLPAAKRISSARLCRLLLMAAETQLMDVFFELGG